VEREKVEEARKGGGWRGERLKRRCAIPTVYRYNTVYFEP
jgi:hypothetical protein